MISPEIKDKAIALREEGKSYREISTTLNVSIDWCKKNLKHITKGHLNNDVLDALVSLAIRPEGCSYKELSFLLAKHGISKDKKEAYKRKAKAINPSCLFRPDWMSPNNPKESLDTLYSLAENLHERFHTAINEWHTLQPEQDVYAMKWVLGTLVFISNDYLPSLLEHYNEIKDNLIARNTPPKNTPK